MNAPDLEHLLPEFRAAALLPDNERSDVGSTTGSRALCSPNCRRSSISRRAGEC
jgi:hypothetical protein